jgi:hypothetical protein
MVFDLVLMKAIGGESIYIHFSGANLLSVLLLFHTNKYWTILFSLT